MPHSNETFHILHAPASGDRVVTSLILPVLEEIRFMSIQPTGVLCLYAEYEDDHTREKTKAFFDVLEMVRKFLTSTTTSVPTIALANFNNAASRLSTSSPDDLEHLDESIKSVIFEFWARNPMMNSALYAHDGTRDSGATIVQYLINNGNRPLDSVASDVKTETENADGQVLKQESGDYQQRPPSSANEMQMSERMWMKQREDMVPLLNQAIATPYNPYSLPRHELEIIESQERLTRRLDTLRMDHFEAETSTLEATHPDFKRRWLEMKRHLAELTEQMIEVQDMWRHDHVNLRRRVSELQTRVTPLSPKMRNQDTIMDHGAGTRVLGTDLNTPDPVSPALLPVLKTSEATRSGSASFLPARPGPNTDEATVSADELASHSTQVDQPSSGILIGSSLALPNEFPSQSQSLRSQEPSTHASIDDGLPLAPISATENQSNPLDAILNPSQHYQSLEELERKVVRVLGLDIALWNGFQAWLSAHSNNDSFKRGLTNLVDAFSILHDAGFCGDDFNILVEDQHRPDVAIACAITRRELRSLRDSYEELTNSQIQRARTRARDTFNFLTDDLFRRLQGTTQTGSLDDESVLSGRGSATSVIGGFLDNLFGPEISSKSRFVYGILVLGLVSFVGSHVCRFDQSNWNQSFESFDVGEHYKFVLRDLACLDQFIGGPVWVLVKETTATEVPRFKVSLTLEQFAGLWGPLWAINGEQDPVPLIRTERGFIVPSPNGSSKGKQSGEVECHWTAKLPVSTYTLLSASELILSESSQLLIGSDHSGQEPFHVNTKCCTRIEMAGQRIAKYLQVSGTAAAHYIRDGYEIGFSANQYVGMIGTKTWKRIPARTQKTVLVEQCTKPETPLLPILKLRVGLEISACTGNSQRTTLWDALRLAQKRTKGALPSSPEQHGTANTCSHQIGDIDCMLSCWNIQRDLDGIDAVLSTKLDQQTLRKTIIQSILMLRDTGVDHNEELQAWWPFTNAPMTLRIPQFEPADGKTSYWIPVLKDTRDCSTFAVLSQRCLEFRDKELIRACKKSTTSPLKIWASGVDKGITIPPLVAPTIDASFKTNEGLKDPTILKTRFALEIPLTSKRLWHDPGTSPSSSSEAPQAKLEGGPLLGKGACLQIGQGTFLTVAKAMGKAQPQSLILKRARLTMDLSHASRWVQNRIRGKSSRGFEQICDEVSTGYAVDVFVY